MSLLGDDGRGYELAVKLEALGVWRQWLGDSLYSTFHHCLSSPASWDSFLRADPSKSKSQIHLQLRSRALLFDKAALSLFLPPFSPSSSLALLSKVNPNCLQLHGDDVYYTLDDGDQRREGLPKSHPKSYSLGSRYGEPETDNIPQRFRNDDLPETWYNQFIEKHKVVRPYRISFGDKESDKRSPEEMSAYLGITMKHKRRRVALLPDESLGYGTSVAESTSNMDSASRLDSCNSVDQDVAFLPEIMFMLNCVPESALPPIIRVNDTHKVECHGVLDALPQTRSSVVIERLGISMEHGGSLNRGKAELEGNRKLLGQEQAANMSQKVVARMLTRAGFDSAAEVPVEVLSQLLKCHICKLGRTLKVLADSYRKQCSAIELLKMFLQTVGYGNLMSLMELVKDGTRNVIQPTQQQVHGIQSQLQSQHQASLRLPQQIPRQMHPQMQQMVHPQNLAFQQQQQQLERTRRRQPSTPRPGIDVDKDRSLVQVKVEAPSELDVSSFNPIHSRHPQMQFRQQQLAAMANLHAQSNNQLRQLTSLQVPQMQTPNMGLVRAPPVKVEGFQELMGGDASMKHDTEENKLTSPPSK